MALLGVLAFAGCDDSASTAGLACSAPAGNQRVGEALVHVPPPGGRDRFPILVVTHPAGTNGPRFARFADVSRRADAAHVLVLYPTSRRAGFWQLNHRAGDTDVQGVRDLLDDAARRFCGDPAHVAVAGVSNGGGFAARVGCEMADTFAAVAPVAGGYSSLDDCPDGTRMSVLEIHGSADQIVPYQGRGPERDGDVREYVSGWARRDGCDARPRITHPRRYVTRVVHRHCDVGFAVVHFRLEGTDHGWPGAPPPWPRHHPAGVLAREMVWRFFENRRLTPGPAR